MKVQRCIHGSVVNIPCNPDETYDILIISIIFGEVLTAKKHVICWNITTYKNIDVKLLHPVWKDFPDTVNTVVLTGYRKQLIIILFDKKQL
jgi:hypothetical protein